MSFTLQFGNTWKEKQFFFQKKVHFEGTSYDYKQKIGSLAPTLCVQWDVLYPNALASVCSADYDQIATGCLGNQIDNDFPLESRVQTCLPLLQYPTPTRGKSLEEQDMCATPVLNWENHIKELKRILMIPLGYTDPSLQSRKNCYKSKKKTADTGENNDGQNNSASSPAHQAIQDSTKNVLDGPNSVDNESESNTSGEESRSDNSDEESSNDETTSKKTKPKKLSNYMRRKLQGKIREGPIQLFKNFLFEEDVDLEETNDEKRLRLKLKKKAGRKKPRPKPTVPLKPIKVKPRDKLPLFCLRKYKNLPKLRVQGTWNYLYSGQSGAVATAEGAFDNTQRNVFVGCGTQLRTVCLKPSVKGSMFSYMTDSVWEEDKNKVPTNGRVGQDEPFSDLIYQIVPDEKNSIIAVRRGKSVEIYDVSETPNLVSVIPNLCYGNKAYVGWKMKSCFAKNPLLYSIDLNPHFSSEMITLDENLAFNIVSIDTETSLHSSYLAREHARTYQKLKGYPNLTINDSAGVTYSNSGFTFFAWVDSCVKHFDRRGEDLKMMNEFRLKSTLLFDLRKSNSSLSWSDQKYFPWGKTNRLLNEHISCVKLSQNPTYYYVGTTSRLFMMDLRVPDHPVLKMSHGMKSAAAYIDTYNDGNYEVVVAGAQRTHETFCLVTDHAHVGCSDRPECKARNPVMQCYPRHLSNSRDFYKEAQVQNMIQSWPSDRMRTKDHNYAWTTGLAICKVPGGNNPERPPGVIVFTGNHFGDIFYQEWVQAPLDGTRKTVRGDPKLTNFFSQWKKFMTYKRKDFHKLNTESLNPLHSVNISLFAKTAADSIPKMAKVRSKKFDIFKPDKLQDFLVKKHMPPLNKQIERFDVMNNQKDYVAKRILDVWKEDWQDDDLVMEFQKNAEGLIEEQRNPSECHFSIGGLPDFPDFAKPHEEFFGDQDVEANRDAEENSTDAPLTEEQQRILDEIKNELETNVCDGESSDSDVIWEDGEANNDDDDEIEIDEENDNGLLAGGRQESPNAQGFTLTQDSPNNFDATAFPRLQQFYPVYNVSPHALGGDDYDVGFSNHKAKALTEFERTYDTVYMDDDVNFGISQPIPPSQEELFSSQPSSQQFLFEPFDDRATTTTQSVSQFPYNPDDSGPSSSRMTFSQSQSSTAKRQMKLGF